MKNKGWCLVGIIALCIFSTGAYAETRGQFDMARWNGIMDSVRERATAQNISDATINATLKSPAFIPSIIKSDKNQSEFKLTLNDYLKRTVSTSRIKSGHVMRGRYPTLLARMENTYGVPSHVILAFWGLESNYGETKATHRLKNAFFTLMYDGRRETFFGNQLLALMKIADDNKLDINNIYGSWAGAMGHFQFIPTTLASYGVDGNGDGKIDIINNVSDAMASAANYLHKLGWNPNERIVRRVIVPANCKTDLLKGDVKKSLSEWASIGVTNPDGTPIPTGASMTAGLVADIAALDARSDASAPIVAYLTYPNFYRIKKWNNSNWYAIAIATLADEMK